MKEKKKEKEVNLSDFDANFVISSFLKQRKAKQSQFDSKSIGAEL